MSATAAQAMEHEWMMGGSSDPAVRRDFGIGEQDIAALAVEAIEYAHHMAGRDVVRFVDELGTEFVGLLCQRLGIDEGDLPTC